MYENFIRQRMTQLRLQKGVSEYKMSIDLGHSKGYIQSISSGRAMPSMAEFLAICDYFGITPFDFFNTDTDCIIQIKKLNKELPKLSDKDISLLTEIAKRLNEKS